MTIQTDGFSTTIEFSASASGILLTTLMKEKEVTPPGVDAGGENDTTSMRNTDFRTKQPKSLKTLMNSSLVVFYDPAILDEILATVGVNQSIVITFPDISTWTFWGWLNEFVPNAQVEGEPPTANITIIPSNQNNSGEEVPPAYSAT